MTSVALKDLSNLTYLDISNNKLTHLLDNQFAFMASIETINLSHNSINSIQQFTFTDLSTLQVLDLSSNHLHDDAFLDVVAPIKEINLGNNEYHQINLSALNSISTVFLKNNPWNCSWFLHTMATKEHSTPNIQFGVEFDAGIKYENFTKPSIEELECFDYRQSIENPIARKIVVINPDRCIQKELKNNKKVFFILNCILYSIDINVFWSNFRKFQR